MLMKNMRERQRERDDVKKEGRSCVTKATGESQNWQRLEKRSNQTTRVKTPAWF